MWPDIFPTWWRLVRPLVFERARERLLPYPILAIRNRAGTRAAEVARLARGAIFRRGRRRQAFAGLFSNFREFWHWAVGSGYFAALRIVLRHEFIPPWVEQLPAADRLVLVCAYVDQFNERQLGQALGLSPQEARARALRAYRAFCDLLRANGYGADDDHAIFPPPPILFGLA